MVKRRLLRGDTDTGGQASFRGGKDGPLKGALCRPAAIVAVT